MAKRKDGQMGGHDEAAEHGEYAPPYGGEHSIASARNVIAGMGATGRSNVPMGHQSGHPGGSSSPSGMEKPGRVEHGFQGAGMKGGARYGQDFAEGHSSGGKVVLKPVPKFPEAQQNEGDGSMYEHHGSKPEHDMTLPARPHSPTPGSEIGTNTSRDLAVALPALKDDHSKYDGLTQHGLQMAEAPHMKENSNHNVKPDGGDVTNPKMGNTTPVVREAGFSPKAKEYLKGL